MHPASPPPALARHGRAARVAPGREGFVLALVVLMLFAISMASAAGYLVVGTEAAMARYAADGARALAAAHGGLHRFVAEQLGAVPDSARYAVGGVVADIRARRVAVVDDLTHVYFVRSEGIVPGPPASADAPTRRVVGAYAVHRRRPVPLEGAVVVNVEEFEVYTSTEVSGVDAGALVCPGGAAPSITGAVAREEVDDDGTLTGSPPSRLMPGGYTELVSTMALRWDVLSDPSFPVDFEDAPPNFGALPADSFPVIRVNGSLYATSAWNGRGVLLVRDQFDSSSSFTWSGIVLAGWVDDFIQGGIDGMLIGGFANQDPYDRTQTRGPIRYHSCNVSRANESLSYLELLERTVFEIG